MGYLRDVRRMTVAVSRARLGLYVLGRREVFETCPELRPAFDMLLARPEKLMLVTGELWPTERPNVEEDTAVEGEVCMEGVEHIGQYVFEMSKTKMKQVHGEEGLQDMESSGAVVEEVGDGQAMGYNEDDEAVEPDIGEVRDEEQDVGGHE